MLYRIVAPHFVAGFIYENNRIQNIAPIIYYMKKNTWNIDRVISYCKRKGWTLECYD